MDEAELSRWRAGLEALSSPVIATDDVRREFVDEQGHRRPVDRPFLAWCGRAPVGGRGGARGSDRGSARASLDVVLWEGVVSARGDGGRARAFLQDLAGGLGDGGGGALTAQREFATIEAWTETELSALHALGWLAIFSGEGWVWDRVWDAAAWHVAALQPDNGTNHPWGLHVFLWLEGRRPGEGGLPHAETLLQNCQVGLGRPDLLSAYVLRDSGKALGTGH